MLGAPGPRPASLCIVCSGRCACGPSSTEHSILAFAHEACSGGCSPALQDAAGPQHELLAALLGARVAPHVLAAQQLHQRRRQVPGKPGADKPSYVSGPEPMVLHDAQALTACLGRRSDQQVYNSQLHAPKSTGAQSPAPRDVLGLLIELPPVHVSSRCPGRQAWLPRAPACLFSMIQPPYLMHRSCLCYKMGCTGA